MSKPLSQHLLEYFKSTEGVWHKKVNLYVEGDNWGYAPESVGRALRILESHGKISVDYYEGRFSKNLAKYAFKPQEPKQAKFEIKEVNGRTVAVYA